jgi:hypothetical protein
LISTQLHAVRQADVPGGREQVRDRLLGNDRGMGICRRRDARVVVLRHLQRVELRVDVVRGQASVVAARARAEEPVWKSKFYGAFVLNHRVVLHAIDVAPAR